MQELLYDILPYSPGVSFIRVPTEALDLGQAILTRLPQLTLPPNVMF